MDSQPHLSRLFAKAKQMAKYRHSHQKRKGTDQPFVTHLERIRKCALDSGKELLKENKLLPE